MPSPLWSLCLAGVLACERAAPLVRHDPEPAERAAPLRTPTGRPPLPVVTEEGVGPIVVGTQVTEDALRRLFPGYDVKTEVGFDPYVAVYDGDERLFDVHSVNGTVVLVRVESPRIASRAGWRAGATLDEVRPLGGCECWPDGIACYAKDSRVIALIEDKDSSCDGLQRGLPAEVEWSRRLGRGDPATLATLRGRRIGAVLWSASTNPSR